MFKTVMIILGLIITMGGVGGVEASPDLMAMLGSTAISVVGVCMMWIGVASEGDGYADTYLYSTRIRR